MSRRKVVSVIIIIAAVAMVVFGVYRNEVTDVFNKAIRICLECIGIGCMA